MTAELRWQSIDACLDIVHQNKLWMDKIVEIDKINMKTIPETAFSTY